MPINVKIASLVLLLLVGAWSVAVLAQPPAHAPAHGWRKKHDPYYAGRGGARWEHDFEISSGRCNRDTIGAVVGGVVGGVIANRVGDAHRTVATIIGVAAGALIGHRIGREFDERDRSCVGHALEIGAAGKPVTWTNEATGVRYDLVPGRDRQRNGAACREFTMNAVAGSEKSSRRGLACQSEPGVWQFVE